MTPKKAKIMEATVQILAEELERTKEPRLKSGGQAESRCTGDREDNDSSEGGESFPSARTEVYATARRIIPTAKIAPTRTRLDERKDVTVHLRN
jgi:hypothetical protein